MADKVLYDSSVSFAWTVEELDVSIDDYFEAFEAEFPNELRGDEFAIAKISIHPQEELDYDPEITDGCVQQSSVIGVSNHTSSLYERYADWFDKPEPTFETVASYVVTWADNYSKMVEEQKNE